MSSINIFRNEEDTVTYSAGDTIFSVGDPGEVMFAVKSGAVEIFFNEQLLETVREGGIFGEMALFDHEVRSATAIAKTDCELVRVDEDRFDLLVKFNPYFALEVLRITVRRLRRMTFGAS
jgi:CRP/FNR family cyclic AMP-dependent transcriptional regulator